MSSRNLTDAVPELQTKVPVIISEFNSLFPERTLFVVCTLRSTEEQQAIWKIGRETPPIGPKYIRTWVDGIIRFSKHNPDPNEPLAKAVDFGVLVGGKYIDINQYYYPLLDLARKYNLTSGGDFHNTGLPLDKILQQSGFKDWPHIEVKGSLYQKQL
jgi:hypothetical protein